MKFSQVNDVRIPSGSAIRIRHGDKVLWSPPLARYVSLGDSIAAGHTINSAWEDDYGTNSQYGNNGNTQTAIVPNSYTDLIHKDLVSLYGGTVSAMSFAKSGDRVDDLIAMLDHDVVNRAIAKADYVTVCIGANDVLEPALSQLEDYINAGDSALQEIQAVVNANLAILADDTNANSYTALFNKLSAINPDAKYVFMTVYNPYRYLHIDEGTDGFFSPLLNTIPDINMFGFDIDGIIKNGLLSADAVELLYDRVNGLPAWAENNVTQLNAILRNKIAAYQSVNPNFMLTEAKTLYEVFPDRPIPATKHYNDLVSVEYTSGYDTAQMDWGRLWEDSDVGSFWWDLATKYISTSGLDIGGLASDLIAQTVEKVIVPDIDPHPEEYGHYVLKRSFVDTLGLQALDRHTITYNANGASGTMASQTVVGVDGLAAFTNLAANAYTAATEGYYFNGWNTAAGGGGTAYANVQLVGVTGDMTLYAQWSNIYVILFKHSNKTNLYTDDETGHKECYALWIDGEEQADFGKFSEGSERLIYRPYGAQVGVVVSNYNPSELTYDDCDCDVYWNGTTVASGYRGTNYTFTLTCNVTIDFQWKVAGSLVTFDAQSWEDCYITTM